MRESLTNNVNMTLTLNTMFYTGSLILIDPTQQEELASEEEDEQEEETDNSFVDDASEDSSEQVIISKAGTVCRYTGAI